MSDFAKPAKPRLGTGLERPAGNTIGVWLGDVLAHTGQIAYPRGMLKGRDWFS